MRLLQGMMHCEEHETVLRELATAGRITVIALAARLGIGQKKLSLHLHDLYVAGLVDRQQVGKFA
jgi:DNA-binding transcriptional ArsR family regulator